MALPRDAAAQAHSVLLYNGGPVLDSFTIYPIYYGNWSNADLNAEQTYLASVVGYINGTGAPAGQQQQFKQYGVYSAQLSSYVTTGTTAAPAQLQDQDIRNIVHAAQSSGQVPQYAAGRLFMVFPAHGFWFPNGCAYHSSESSTSFYGTVTADCGPTLALVSAHEIFEAATDPAVANVSTQAWVGADNNEVIDVCTQIFTGSDGPITGGADNLQNGTCSSTGYTRPLTFTTTATSQNARSNVVYLDDPALNGNPNARIIVTPNWNPPGGPGVYNDHPTGVFYNTTTTRWGIYNEDMAGMPIGASFNVRIDNGAGNGFVQTATSSNTLANHTYIDNPLTNGKPNLAILATHVWNPGGVGGTYVNAPLGVYYSSLGKWAVYTQDGSPLPVGAAFNIRVEFAKTHVATSSNITSNWTTIDHPLANLHPEARIVATPNWDPPGSSGVYDKANIGVWYNPTTGRWCIFNENASAMPVGAAFDFIVE